MDEVVAMDYEKLVKELRNTERICRDRMDGTVMLEAQQIRRERDETNA